MTHDFCPFRAGATNMVARLLLLAVFFWLAGQSAAFSAQTSTGNQPAAVLARSGQDAISSQVLLAATGNAAHASAAHTSSPAQALDPAPADSHPWWFWPLALLFFCFILGIIAVVAGVGGGVLFVPLVSGFFPFHLDFVRGAGLLTACGPKPDEMPAAAAPEPVETTPPTDVAPPPPAPTRSRCWPSRSP